MIRIAVAATMVVTPSTSVSDGRDQDEIEATARCQSERRHVAIDRPNLSRDDNPPRALLVELYCGATLTRFATLTRSLFARVVRPIHSLPRRAQDLTASPPAHRSHRRKIMGSVESPPPFAAVRASPGTRSRARHGAVRSLHLRGGRRPGQAQPRHGRRRPGQRERAQDLQSAARAGHGRRRQADDRRAVQRARGAHEGGEEPEHVQEI